MVDSTKPYINIIRESLTYALNIKNFPSMIFEKINRPQIEVVESKELLMKPIIISRNENEKVEIEASINSVKINIKTIRLDVEELLSSVFCKFLMHRTDKLNIFRKVPKDNYDISILITNFHLEHYKKEYLVDYIIDFISNLDNEIIKMRMIVNLQLRMASNYFIDKLKI